MACSVSGHSENCHIGDTWLPQQRFQLLNRGFLQGVAGRPTLFAPGLPCEAGRTPAVLQAFCATSKYVCCGQNGLKWQLLLYCQLTQNADRSFGYLESTQMISHLHEHLSYLQHERPYFHHRLHAACQNASGKLQGSVSSPRDFCKALLLLSTSFLKAVPTPEQTTIGHRPWEVSKLQHKWSVDCSLSLRDARTHSAMKWISSPIFGRSLIKCTCPALLICSDGAQLVPLCCWPQPRADWFSLWLAQGCSLGVPSGWNLGSPGYHSPLVAVWGYELSYVCRLKYHQGSLGHTLRRMQRHVPTKAPRVLTAAAAAQCSLCGSMTFQGPLWLPPCWSRDPSQPPAWGWGGPEQSMQRRPNRWEVPNLTSVVCSRRMSWTEWVSAKCLSAWSSCYISLMSLQGRLCVTLLLAYACCLVKLSRKKSENVM